MKTYKFMVPIEMPRGTHYGNNYYEVYSKKIDRNVKLFSNLEYENFLCLELNSKVEYFCEQPLKVEVLMNEGKKTTTFDMWVKYKNGDEEFQEVKYLCNLNGTDDRSIKNQKQINAQRQWCQENGQNYVIRTEEDVQTGTFKIRNLMYIAGRVRRFDIPNKDYFRDVLLNYMGNYDKTSIHKLIDGDILPQNRSMEFICLMYYEGVIDLKIEDKPISRDTEVKLYGN